MVQKVLALVVLLAAPSHAAVAPSFEGMLNGFRAQLIESAPKRAAVRSQSELDRLSWDADRARDAASQIRRDLSSVQRRLRTPNDPFLRSELTQLNWRLRDFVWALEEMERRAGRERDAAKPDPNLARAADRFKSSLSWVRNEVRWLESDARWVYWDLQRAGFGFEAWEIDRQTRAATSSTEDLESLAAEIVKRSR